MQNLNMEKNHSPSAPSFRNAWQAAREISNQAAKN